MFNAAPWNGIEQGYIERIFAPAQYIGTGGPGTFEITRLPNSGRISGSLLRP